MLFKKGICFLILGLVFPLLFVQLLFVQSQSVAVDGDENEDKNIMELIPKFQQLLQESRDKVSKAKAVELGEQSRKAFRAGRREEAIKLLKEAISLLEGKNIRDIGQREGYKDSPFGIHHPNVIHWPLAHGMKKPPGFDEPKDLVELGVKWIRYDGVLVWDAIEKERGKYDWTKPDSLFGEIYKHGIKIMVVITAYNKLDSDRSGKGYLPKKMDWYLKYLQKAMERYDGDGFEDAPGSPGVDVWQIENEVDTPVMWKDTAKNYALLLKESYRVIKNANPKAKVAIAGLAGPGHFPFYSEVLEHLETNSKKSGERFFDIFDFHWSGQFGGSYKERQPGGYRLDEFIKKLRTKLDSVGYKEVPLWICEMSYYEGQPQSIAGRFDEKFKYKHRSETDHAVSMFKMYICSLAHGVSKAFWVSLTAWHAFGGVAGGYWDTVGLINNPRNDGRDHKKLAYYTYQKMVEVLEGSDWNNIQIIQEKDGIYIYKFTKQRRPIWVAWNDNESAKTVKITGIGTSKVKVTYAVSNEESGKKLKAYNTAFGIKILDTQDNQISLKIDNIPVFIE